MNSEKVSVFDLPVHPAALLFPDLPPDEYKKLKQDIQAHGQIEPITVSADGKLLLDGRNRRQVCKELEIEPRVERFDAKPGQSEADYIWAKNVLRRHLTDDQRAAIAHKRSDAERAAAKQCQKRKPDSVLVDSPKQKPVHVRKAIAAKAKVSEHKVRQVEAVAKHRPDLLPKVESGETSLKNAVKEAMPLFPRRRPFKSAAHAAAHYGFILDNKEPASEFRSNGKPKDTDESVKAWAWLYVTLSNFEKDNVATVDPKEMLDQIKPEHMEILRSCHAWMEKILRVEKAKAAGQH